MGLVNGRGRFSTPHSSETPGPIFVKLEIYNYYSDTAPYTKFQGATSTWVVWSNSQFDAWKFLSFFLWSDEGTKAVFSGNCCQIGRNIAIGLLFNADDDQKRALATTAGAFWAILEYWRHEFWLLFTLLTVLCRKKNLATLLLGRVITSLSVICQAVS